MNVIRKLVNRVGAALDVYDNKPKLGHTFKKQGGWTAGAIVGSAVIGAMSSNSAAKKQAKGQDKALAAQQEMLGPYSTAGQQGLGAVQSFVDNGARFSDTQAYKDITNSAKASGMGMSGNRLTALTDYYATNYRPQRLNELMKLPTLGANAAAGQATNMGSLYNQQGATQAAGILGMGNSASNALNQLGFLNMYNQGQSAGVQSGVNNLLNQPGMF